ncbi:MAG: hypothetical protein KJ052_07680 [Candidatus Hydrogenedentes bacterium]|nr:hypothetical protein [Candidatus Hydrogenedentota bacterium]
MLACKITPIAAGDAADIISALGGNSPHPAKWLLAHCHDGVTWGLWSDGSGWATGDTAFPEVCPRISSDNLLELRLFDETHELLLWRSKDSFAGRICEETDEAVEEWAKPAEELRVILGDRMLAPPSREFTLVGDGAGARHAVPMTCEEAWFKGGLWPLRLKMRHYFERNEETGAVRAAMSRLVNLEAHHE